ncbi:hypothetical protein STEG23_024590 [Scotinomys teguina]
MFCGLTWVSTDSIDIHCLLPYRQTERVGEVRPRVWKLKRTTSLLVCLHRPPDLNGKLVLEFRNESLHKVHVDFNFMPSLTACEEHILQMVPTTDRWTLNCGFKGLSLKLPVCILEFMVSCPLTSVPSWLEHMVVQLMSQWEGSKEMLRMKLESRYCESSENEHGQPGISAIGYRVLNDYQTLKEDFDSYVPREVGEHKL